MAITYEDIKKVNKDIKTKDIKGKAYAEVQERITAFRKLYPEGFITTNIVSSDNGMVIMGASCGFYNEDGSMHVLGTGTAYEKEGASQINRTSFIENCETSAVGRALGMAGFGIVASLSSADEVVNAIYQQNNPPEEKKLTKVFRCQNCKKDFTDEVWAKKTKARWNKYICPACVDAKAKEVAAAKVADPEPVPPPIPEESNIDLPFPLD